jgi:preprotein translocase subunit SecA
MFGAMLDRVKHELISFLSRVKVRGEEDVKAAHQGPAPAKMQYQHAQAPALAAAAPAAPLGQPAAPLPGGLPVPPVPPADPAKPFVRGTPKVGRNDPCHCGSGKKFKHCHGKLS